MKKVILIGPFPPPINGCAFANKILHENLMAKGVSCEIIDTSTNIISSKQGSNFSLKKAFNFFKVYVKIFKIRRFEKVYITPGHTFYGILKYLPFILMARIYSRPYYLHIHGNYLGKEYQLISNWKKKILEFLISKAAGGIVLSDSLKGNLSPFLKESKVFIVENFVENSLFENRNVKKRKDKLRILYLSNLMKEKGIIEFLDALLYLQKEGVNFEAKIAGNIEKEIVEEVNAKLEILDNVDYVGVVRGEAKKSLFLNANLFILPTYYKMEGQPISLLEAMATQNIIITTKHSGIPDIISEDNGFFVDKKSSTSIANVLLEINNNMDILERFWKTNLSYCKVNFTEERFATKIMKVLKIENENSNLRN
jgi:glycosyltransferase involved in cell wall biosynthesis